MRNASARQVHFLGEFPPLGGCGGGVRLLNKKMIRVDTIDKMEKEIQGLRAIIVRNAKVMAESSSSRSDSTGAADATTEPLSEASLESLHAEPFFVDTVGTRGGGNDALEPGSPPVLPFDFIEGAAPNEIQTHTQARRVLAHLD